LGRMVLGVNSFVQFFGSVGQVFTPPALYGRLARFASVARRTGANAPFPCGRITLHVACLALMDRTRLPCGNRHFNAQAAVSAHDRFTNDPWVNTVKVTG